jgi:hypothetical protein
MMICKHLHDSLTEGKNLQLRCELVLMLPIDTHFLGPSLLVRLFLFHACYVLGSGLWIVLEYRSDALILRIIWQYRQYTSGYDRYQ